MEKGRCEHRPLASRSEFGFQPPPPPPRVPYWKRYGSLSPAHPELIQVEKEFGLLTSDEPAWIGLAVVAGALWSYWKRFCAVQESTVGVPETPPSCAMAVPAPRDMTVRLASIRVFKGVIVLLQLCAARCGG